MQLVLFFNVICLACYALLFFFGCDNIKMAGATMPYFNSGENRDIFSWDSFQPFITHLSLFCSQQSDRGRRALQDQPHVLLQLWL